MHDTPQHTHSRAFRTTLIGYTLFNTVGVWVVEVLALFVSYPGSGRDHDKATRIGEHLQKVLLGREGVITFAVYSLISVGVHVAFWRALMRNVPEHTPFTLRHVTYAVAMHVGLFVGAHALAVLLV